MTEFNLYDRGQDFKHERYCVADGTRPLFSSDDLETAQEVLLAMKHVHNEAIRGYREAIRSLSHEHTVSTSELVSSDVEIKVA